MRRLRRGFMSFILLAPVLMVASFGYGVAEPVTGPQDISGTWKNHEGVTFEFTRTGDKFTFSDTGATITGAITVNGSNLIIEYTQHEHTYFLPGTITEFDSAGVPKKMVWKNDWVFERITGPGEPSVTVPENTGLSGTWISSAGTTLEITQIGNMFEWLDKSNNQKGMGTIDGSKLTVTWQDKYGTHTSTWTITGFDSSGRPVRMLWENGQVFERSTVSAQPPPPPKKVHDIAGEWNSNIKVIYKVTQTGDRFEWLDTNINLKGTGSLSGDDVTVTWTDVAGTHTANGKITDFDASGAPTTVVWDLGIVWERGMGLPQPPPMGQPAQDIAGEWDSNIGFRYQVNQVGDLFAWIDSNSVKGTGTINGKNLETKWIDQLGPHTATGVLELGTDGKPIKIVWSNGVVFERAELPSELGIRLKKEDYIGVIYEGGEKKFDKGGLEYVYIPPGSFRMGCVPGDDDCYYNEKPRHRVTISKGFWMSKTEVTIEAYRKFLKATGRKPPEPPDFFQESDHPIVNVIWEDAKAYCEWIGGRLPTEAEWEYAARGGEDGKKYIWGDGDMPIVNGVKQANIPDEAYKRDLKKAKIKLRWGYEWWIVSGYDDGYGLTTSPVGSFAPNGFGLYDMIGNVSEWCSDRYGEAFYGSQASLIDPVGPRHGKYCVTRGGSWTLGKLEWIRASNREWSRLRPYKDLEPGHFQGFRCVLEAK